MHVRVTKQELRLEIAAVAHTAVGAAAAVVIRKVVQIPAERVKVM